MSLYADEIYNDDKSILMSGYLYMLGNLGRDRQCKFSRSVHLYCFDWPAEFEHLAEVGLMGFLNYFLTL